MYFIRIFLLLINLLKFIKSSDLITNKLCINIYKIFIHFKSDTTTTIHLFKNYKIILL